MKSYILFFLLPLTLLFSCNQKGNVKNDEPYFTEGLQVKKETRNTENKKTDSFLSYTNVQLDSFFQVSRDSLLDIAQKSNFEKDTIINNEFSQAIFGVATDELPNFVFIESKYCDIGGDDFFCQAFLYRQKNKGFEMVETFINPNPVLYSWYSTEIERRDINFDDKVDVVIKRPWKLVSRLIVDYILISDIENKRIEVITSTDRLLTNQENKTVISFTDGGNCCTHHKIINEWQGDSLVKIRSLEKSYNHADGGQILEEFVMKNGEKTKIKSQKMSSDKAQEYFENYQ